MADRSQAEIEADLAAAYAARTKVLTVGQSIAGDNGSKSYPSLSDINKVIRELQQELAQCQSGISAGISLTPTNGGN